MSTQKLKLGKETLLQLSPGEALQAQGGINLTPFYTAVTCPSQFTCPRSLCTSDAY
jgi:hypothetical protein